MRYIKIEDLLVFRSRWGQGDTLWKNSVLKKDFRDFFHNKCWYTEVPLVGQDVHIDHFRPKAAVKPFENFKYNHLIQDKGYYWLANDPSNYRACCIYANRKTGGGGKGNYFPLADDGVYQSEKDENNEHPMLLDPCVAEDVKLLSFLGNRVVPATDDELGKERVAVPYWSIVKSMQDTGEIYCDLGGDLTEQAIQKYNDCLDDWEKRQGYEIISDGNAAGNAACIAAYEAF